MVHTNLLNHNENTKAPSTVKDKKGQPVHIHCTCVISFKISNWYTTEQGIILYIIRQILLKCRLIFLWVKHRRTRKNISQCFKRIKGPNKCTFQILGGWQGRRTSHLPPSLPPPLIFKAKLKILSPYPPKIRFKIIVTPPPPHSKGKSKLRSQVRYGKGPSAKSKIIVFWLLWFCLKRY